MKTDKHNKASPVKVLGRQAMKSTKGGSTANVDVTVIHPSTPAPLPIPYPNTATETTAQTCKRT